MDFLDPRKKRAHKIRLYIGYGLVATALVLATIVLAFATYGYDIDRKTGNVIQNGLIIVDAHPVSATIKVNGITKGNTDNRLVLPAGQYNIELKRDGYRSWTHAVNLGGSTIEQLAYPFLFPSKLVTKNVQEYPTVPKMASQSPDRHWLVVHTPASTQTFQVFDLITKNSLSTTINLPADTVTVADGEHTYEAVEWADDNLHVLLKHSFTGGQEFIVLDRAAPANSINLNKIFVTQPFTSISLRDKKSDQFYLLNSADGNLYQAELKTKLVTAVLQHVISYKSYQADTLLYTANPNASVANVELHLRAGSQDHILKTLPQAATYMLDMAQFSGHMYLVGGSQADGRVYLYKDPFDSFNARPARTPEPFRVLVLTGAQYVSFSANSRFIAVQGATAFAFYDAESGRQSRFNTRLILSPGQKATWMDGHRLSLISGGNVHVFDFDGSNLQKLSGALDQFPPLFDRDYLALYDFAPVASAPEKAMLTRTELKVTP